MQRPIDTRSANTLESQFLAPILNIDCVGKPHSALNALESQKWIEQNKGREAEPKKLYDKKQGELNTMQIYAALLSPKKTGPNANMCYTLQSIAIQSPTNTRESKNASKPVDLQMGFKLSKGDLPLLHFGP